MGRSSRGPGDPQDLGPLLSSFLGQLERSESREARTLEPECPASSFNSEWRSHAVGSPKTHQSYTEYNWVPPGKFAVQPFEGEAVETSG